MRASPLIEALEPRVLLSAASPYQTAVDTFIGSSGTTVIAGPGGYGGTPLLDLNHDGVGDMIVRYSILNGGQFAPQVGAVFSNADGSARVYNIANYPTGTAIKQIVVADVNKDGQPDVVVLRQAVNDDFFVDVFLGHPDGTFTSTTPTDVSQQGNSNAPSLNVFDMTGDGKPDIVLQSLNTVTVLKGNGDGTFVTPFLRTQFTAINGNALTNISFQTDVSGDGITDVVISGLSKTGTETLAVYKGLATGSYNTTPSFSDTTNNLTLLSLQKLATNGHYDIIAYSPALPAPGTAATFFVFSGNGDGTFNTTPTFSTGMLNSGLYNQLDPPSGPLQPLPITDLNNDGKPDMVVMEGGSSSNIILHILKNTTAANSSSATFTDVQDIPVGDFQSDSSLAVEDVDGDGTPDLVVQQKVSGNFQVTIFFGNGDGTFDPTGVTVAEDSSLIAPPTLADLNGDHKLDVVFSQGADVVAFLNTSGRAFQATPEETDVANSQQDVGGNLLDVNGDNEADLLTYQVSAGMPPFNTVTPKIASVQANISNGDGTFTPTSPFAVLSPGTQAAELPIICDINGDGKPDLVFTDGKGVYEVINGATPPADLAGSTAQTALDLGPLNGAISTIGFIPPPQPSAPPTVNFYTVEVPTAGPLRFTVTPEPGVAQTSLFVFAPGGGIFDGGSGSGGTPTVAEIPSGAAGTYTIKVESTGAATNYRLDIESPSTTPQLAVFQGFNAFSSEQSSVAFGHVLVNTTDTEQDFTVRNDGDSTLNFDPVHTTLPAGFSFDQVLPATLAPQASATFSIVMNDSAPGNFSGNVSIASDDPNGPFLIAVSGSVKSEAPAQSPSISVTATGNITVTSRQANAIDIGTAGQGAADPSLTFTVANSGTAPLHLGALPNLSAGFLYGPGTLDATIAPGHSSSFTVELDTTNIGDFTDTIAFTTDDPTVPNFSIPISGQVTAAVNESKTLTPGSSTSKFTYTDSNGTAVTIQFTGKNGSVTVNRSAPAGQPGDATSITFVTTDPKAGITITTKGGTGVTTVGSVTGSSPLASFTATTTDLTGEGIVLTGGTIDKVSVRDLLNGADIVLPGVGPASGITVALASAGAGSDLTSGTGIASLTFNDWAGGGTVSAPWIGKLTGNANKPRALDGSFDANLTLAGTNAPKGVTLGTAKIAGGLGSGTWDVTGVIGTITGGATGAAESPWTLLDATAITGLTLGDVADADVTFGGASEIKTIKAVEWLAGNITGGWIGSLTTTGDKNNNIAGDFDADVSLADGGVAKTLGILTIAGTLNDSTVTSDGIVGAVTLGAMDGSQLLIGDGGVTGLVSDPAVFVSQPLKPNLVSFTIKGLAVGQTSLTDSIIDAWNIGKVSLKFVDSNPESDPFGFAADRIGSLIFQSNGINNDKPVTLKNLDTPGSMSPVGSFTLNLV